MWFQKKSKSSLIAKFFFVTLAHGVKKRNLWKQKKFCGLCYAKFCYFQCGWEIGETLLNLMSCRIRELTFEEKSNDLEELAWKALKSFVENFLGNHKNDNDYLALVGFQKLVCNVLSTEKKYITTFRRCKSITIGNEAQNGRLLLYNLKGTCKNLIRLKI